MANKEKSAAKAAAAKVANQKAPEAKVNEGTQDPSLNTIVNAMKAGSLSQDGKAITANLVQKRWVEGENIPDGIREGAGVIVDAFLGDIIVTSIAQGNSVFAGIIARDEKKYLAIKSALATQGISLPDFKSLPAPTDEQLKAAGVNLLPAETAVVTVSADKVDKKAVEQKKKELETIKKAVDNPAQVENEDQLKASLAAMLIKPIANGPDGIDARIMRTIGFYKGYLSIQANKIEDEAEKKAKLDEIKGKSTADLMSEISSFIGSCPFAIIGGAYMLRKQVAQTGTPISSFCLYRRTAASVKNGTADDQQVADIVRIVSTWSCQSVIDDFNKQIKDNERIIKKNEEEAKKGDKVAKATVKTHKEDIENRIKPKIAEMETLIEEINNPSFDAVDKLIENYKSEDTESEAYKLAKRTVGEIMRTYYKDVDVSKADENSMLANVQQRAGVILNMFHKPLNQNQSYAEANLSEIELKKEEKKDE